MIEHASASYRVVCDRGVSHEIVRHRLFSFAQESTRYCNYKGGVTFVRPHWFGLEALVDIKKRFLHHLVKTEELYQSLVGNLCVKPQDARGILPNALKTEIVITGNFREWQHFFSLRCDYKAHPDMQKVAHMLRDDLRKRVPIIFGV